MAIICTCGGTQIRIAGDLCPIQRKVLAMLAMDKTMKCIAMTMKLSLKTVEYHRAQIRKKLGDMGVAGMTREAIRLGLVDCPCACHRKGWIR